MFWWKARPIILLLVSRGITTVGTATAEVPTPLAEVAVLYRNAIRDPESGRQNAPVADDICQHERSKGLHITELTAHHGRDRFG